MQITPECCSSNTITSLLLNTVPHFPFLLILRPETPLPTWLTPSTLHTVPLNLGKYLAPDRGAVSHSAPLYMGT